KYSIRNIAGRRIPITGKSAHRNSRCTIGSSRDMAPLREAAAVSAWRRTFSTIPTVLGRLAYLASLRDVNTGAYQHVGLGERVGEAEVDRITRDSHLRTFQEWLCFPLERQKQELEEYFSGLGADRREIVSNWLSLEPYGNWVP